MGTEVKMQVSLKMGKISPNGSVCNLHLVVYQEKERKTELTVMFS